MKTIKIELKDINPNPFKKEIDGGNINEEQVQKLMEGYKQTTFHENILARKNKKGKYELVYGHHRLEAAKRVYGKNYKISLNIVDYNDKQMIIDLCRENLTQRYNEFRQEMDAVLLVKKYLATCDEPSHVVIRKQGGGLQPSGDSARDIATFLSKEGKVISYHKVADLIRMNEKLSLNILNKIKKYEGNENKEDKVTYEQARIISTLEDRDEQEELLNAVQKAKKESGGRSDKLLNGYKNASEEVKKKVRDGEISLVEVPIERLKEDIKKKIAEEKENNKGKINVTHFKQYQNEASSRIGKTNSEIIQTCSFLNGLHNSDILYKLDWTTQLKIIEAMTLHGKGYTKIGETILEKVK